MQMMNASSEAQTNSLVWDVRLYEAAPARRTVVFLVALLVAMFGALILKRPLLGLIGSVMILASTAEFWMGAKYRINESGASARVGLSTSAIDWSAVKRVIVEQNSLILSPLADSSRMDAFRGVTLRTTPENHDEVMGALKHWLGEDVRFLGE